MFFYKTCTKLYTNPPFSNTNDHAEVEHATTGDCTVVFKVVKALVHTKMVFDDQWVSLTKRIHTYRPPRTACLRITASAGTLKLYTKPECPLCDGLKVCMCNMVDAYRHLDGMLLHTYVTNIPGKAGCIKTEGTVYAILTIVRRAH